MKFDKLYESIIDDYSWQHTAPMHDSGSPLHDLSNTYPDDVYSKHVVDYYGDGDIRLDREAAIIIQFYHNKPNKTIRVYRAVPNELSIADKIAKCEKDKSFILKYGKAPKDATTSNSNDYYGELCNTIDDLKKLPQEQKKVIEINIGDWITISKSYAKNHGESALNGSYKIISKVVKAKDIFTNGDSMLEWGYDPQ